MALAPPEFLSGGCLPEADCLSAGCQHRTVGGKGNTPHPAFVSLELPKLIARGYVPQPYGPVATSRSDGSIIGRRGDGEYPPLVPLEPTLFLARVHLPHQDGRSPISPGNKPRAIGGEGDGVHSGPARSRERSHAESTALLSC